MADLVRGVETRNPSSCSRADSSDLSWLICHSQHLLHKAISIVAHHWPAFHQWRNLSLTAWVRNKDLSTVSAVRSTLSAIEGIAIQISDYCDRLYRYLQAARSFERSLLDSGDRTLQQANSLVLFTSPRQEAIRAIAARAGLRLDEVPSLALSLEGRVRSIERWRLDKSRLTRVYELGQQIHARLYRWAVQGAIVLACIIVLTSGWRLNPLMWLVAIVVLLNLATISRWFDPS